MQRWGSVRIVVLNQQQPTTATGKIMTLYIPKANYSRLSLSQTQALPVCTGKTEAPSSYVWEASETPSRCRFSTCGYSNPQMLSPQIQRAPFTTCYPAPLGTHKSSESNPPQHQQEKPLQSICCYGHLQPICAMNFLIINYSAHSQ